MLLIDSVNFIMSRICGWFSLWIVKLWVENFYNTLPDEVHLFDVTLVWDDWLTRCVDSAVHVDNQLICEASFTLIEEVVERFFELSEYSCALNEVSLHFGSHLMVEFKLFDYQVEIEIECFLNIVSDVIVQGWLNVVRFVRFLNLFDPHIQLV